MAVATIALDNFSFGEFRSRQEKQDIEEVLFEPDCSDFLLKNVDINNLDIEDVDISYFESDSEPEQIFTPIYVKNNHDCMLGGQCCKREMPRTPVIITPRPAVVPAVTPPQPVQPAPYTPVQTAPSVLITHSANKVVTIQKCISARSDRPEVVVVTNNVRTLPAKNESRSLLLNRTAAVQPKQQPQPALAKVVVKREFPTPNSSRPETPMSLSEESEDDYTPISFRNPDDNSNIFRSALDVLTTPTSNIWDDELLAESVLRTKDEKPTVLSQSELLRISANAQSDHCYGSSKEVVVHSLGVDTPSDSGEEDVEDVEDVEEEEEEDEDDEEEEEVEDEEEIDVVSLSERYNYRWPLSEKSKYNRSSCSNSGLSTLPTQHDRVKLEDITTSLLSASQAVSRKLNKTVTKGRGGNKQKRKRRNINSSEEGEEDQQMETLCQPRQVKRQKGADTHRRKKSSRFGEEEDSKEKRDLHNNMERMRRIDLKNSFEELKALVPAVANKERAAKVVILREASMYCYELSADSQSKYIQKAALMKEQERLRRMLSSLRKAAHNSRRH